MLISAVIFSIVSYGQIAIAPFNTIPSSKPSLSSSQRDDHYQWIDQRTNAINRYKNDLGTRKANLAVFNIVNSQNKRAREIANQFELGNMEAAHLVAQSPSLLQKINALFNQGGLGIEFRISDTEELLATKNGVSYSSIKLSDGERNALLIGIEALSAPDSSIIFIDEPERHLYGKIVIEFVSALQTLRPTCCFVIATHTIELARLRENSTIYLVRNVQWNGDNPHHWDLDVLDGHQEIPDHIKNEILGPRRKSLLVEGVETSRDLQLYKILFTEIDITPVQSCKEVEKVVLGLSNIDGIHWVEAYGIIDNDNRPPEVLASLNERNIYSLDFYSIAAVLSLANGWPERPAFITFQV